MGENIQYLAISYKEIKVKLNVFLKKRTLIINTVVSEIERQENVLANTRKLCIV